MKVSVAGNEALSFRSTLEFMENVVSAGVNKSTYGFYILKIP
jgi:hypothetical protein